MRSVIRSVLLAALVLAPASAMAWWPFQPTLPEAAAVQIAMENGVVTIEDVDPTLDADWSIEGYDGLGNRVELVIDGRTGAIERGEMEAR